MSLEGRYQTSWSNVACGNEFIQHGRKVATSQIILDVTSKLFLFGGY